ncbi:MAG: site-specific integrase [Actinobacteria bacterium]|nr:site-specific integrase [Actinomycetota bacterium]
MSYIVQRKERFYVVAYDGLDPLSGKERRRWHPVGHDRDEAEAVRRRLELEPRDQQPATGGPITVSTFLHETWMPRKRRQVRATTAYRYAWFIEHYITPAIGDIPLRRLRVDHLENLYQQLAVTGGRHHDGLAPKTILEVHMIVRAALGLATERQLVVRNVATSAQLKLPRAGGPIARSWTASELASFLTRAHHHRLFPALHLAAHTGMRRGEIVGLKWCDLDTAARRLSIRRTVQCVGGQPVEFGVKTRTSRRTVELDPATIDLLRRWRRRLQRDGLPNGIDDWMFCNPTGRYLNPQSLTPLFDRIVRISDLPRIRFHDLRHTHASLLVASGESIKVVSDRLGHAHPAFAIHTYQHLLFGMSAAAADRFATMIATANR